MFKQIMWLAVYADWIKKNPMSIYEYKHVYNIFANTYILLVLENT